MNLTKKYPRTLHLNNSDTIGPDGDHIFDNSNFEGKEVIVLEKVDGENTSMYRDAIHARSLDGRPHISRAWVKGYHASIRYLIPEGWRIIGENMYAKHSIFYDHLPTYFLVFAIHNGEKYLSYKELVNFCNENKLTYIPPLYRGLWNAEAIHDICYTGISMYGGKQEGYVVRLADSFKEEDFSTSVAKYVRPNHIQTDKHWMYGSITPNKLSKV